MSELDQASRSLLALCDKARSLLEDHQVPTLAYQDQVAAQLRQGLERSARVAIGFVGESQVGKSTLINALLEREALPSGGVGPLTAQATEVEFSKECRLEARYHGRQRLNQLAFTIASYLQRRGELQGQSLPAAEVDEEVKLEFEVLLDQELGQEGGREKASSRRGDYMLSQAQKMLTDGLPEPLRELPLLVLLDGVRAVLGNRPLGDPSALEPLQGRIAELRAKLGKELSVHESALESRRAFDELLRLHAAGWVSPLISELRLGLDSPVLENLTLVDLPGIGMVGDPAAQEAAKFVTQRGDALVIVTRNSGLPETLADLLEKTKVVTKLLFGSVDGEPSISVTLAVTNLDNVAKTRFRERRKAAKERGEPAPTREDVFAELAGDMEKKLRNDVRHLLLHSAAFEDLPAEHRARREEIVTRLADRMRIVCVSAPCYLSLLDDDGADEDDGLGFLKDRGATGVDAIRAELKAVSDRAARRRDGAVREAFEQLELLLGEHLASIDSMYRDGSGLANLEWDEFRAELEVKARELKQQMAAFHGAAQNALTETLPLTISNLCMEAEAQGLKGLERLRRFGQEKLHYQSLKAALLRQGVWEQRNVDYPGDLTAVLVNHIATDWEPRIVKGIKQQVDQMAKRDLALVEQLCDAALQSDRRIVADSHVEAQKRILRGNAQTCVRWTKDRLEELRKAVEIELGETILKPIATACKTMVEDGRHTGTGAKARILEQFHKGGTVALAQARKAAERLLKRQYQGLLAELSEGYLAEHHDPVQAAYEALTNEQLARARRSDAARKRSVLEKVAALQGDLKALSPGAAGER